MALGALEGLVIGVTADRRRDEQTALLERRGASVVHGPTISTHYLEHDDALRAVTLDLIREPPEYLVANTGIGMRAWFEAAAAWDLDGDLLGALGGARIVARGPKAASVVSTHGLEVWARAPGERLEELLDVLSTEPLAGCRVVVQEHGAEASGFADALRAVGAAVSEVPIYRWRLPDDPTPARRLVEAVADGRVDAVTFTSAPAVHNLFELARGDGTVDDLRRGFNRGVVAACVGSVCADGARREGVDAPIAPRTGRLGLLVRALSEHFREECTRLRLGDIDVTIQGAAVSVGDTTVQLTNRERAVLHVLAERPGAVVPKARLLLRVWGPGAHDPHALEMTIVRLRNKLGPCRGSLSTVPGRGYRLVPG